VTHSCHLVENFFEVMFNVSHLSSQASLFIIWWEHKAFITHVQQHFSMLLLLFGIGHEGLLDQE
jgi:hypothetical protein